MTYRDLYFWLGREAESVVIHPPLAVAIPDDAPCPIQDELG